MKFILRAALPLLVITGAAFGQCGAGGKLIINPITGLPDCTGLAGTGTGNVTTGVTLTANLPLIGAGGSAIGVGTKTGTGTNFVTDTSPTINSPTFVTPALGTPASATLTNATGLPEAGLALTDITTNNSSTSKHGFLLKLDNNAAHFMNGQGAWATPAGGSGLAISGDGGTQYTEPLLNFITGTGGTVAVADVMGTQVNVTVGVNTSTVNILANNQTVSGIKTQLANTFVLTPGADSGTTDGALNINASKQFDWYDATNSVRRIAYAFTGTPATASQLIGGSSTSGLTSVYSTSGTGTTVCLTGACTLNNPVINSLVNLSVYDGPIIAPAYLSATVNAQTGTTYTYLNTDRGKLVTHTNSSSIAGSLPQANGSTFISGWYMDAQNRGAGTLTITPTTSTIDGSSSLALTTGQGVRIFSDGANYFTQRGIGGGGSSSATKLVDSSGLDTVLTGHTASAVNQVTVTNAATGNGPTISATGSDSPDIQLNLAGKGAGKVNVGLANYFSNSGSAWCDSANCSGVQIGLNGTYATVNQSWRAPQFYGGGNGPSGVSGCSATVEANAKDPVGAIISGTTGPCTFTITFDKTADHNINCYMNNETHPGNTNQMFPTGSNTTTASFTGTTVTGDRLAYGCFVN